MSENYYICPRPIFDAKYTHRDLLGYSKDIIATGSGFLRNQKAYQYIDDAVRLVDGEAFKNDNATLSDVKTDATVRNIKELIAAQSNLRIIPLFKTELENFRNTANVLNKLYMSWQSSTFADRQIRKAWQYAAVCGTGYISPRWDRNYWGKRRGDIVLDALGPMDVMPVGINTNFDLQSSYVVVVHRKIPYHEAIRTYSQYSDLIVPTSDGITIPGSVLARSVEYFNGIFRKFGPGSSLERTPVSSAMVDFYYLYIDDDSVNNTTQPILMGDPGTSWSYTVPYIGQRIPDGNDSRDATREDCFLYPNRRLVICTDSLCVNPDPCRQVSPYWHGQAPVVQFRSDDWPWSYLGYPLTRLGESIEKGNVGIMRGVIDAMNVKLAPPRSYDRNTMSEGLATAINTRLPNQVVGLDMTFGGEQMKPLLTPETYNIPPHYMKFIEEQEGRIKQQMGVSDTTALARARQMPSSDSMEKILEMMGPLVKDQSRNMEASIRALGEMWKCLAFQFYSPNRRYQILGESGIVEEDSDLKPGDMVPSSIPGINPDYFSRAKHHMANFSFQVAPYSIHELSSTTRRLFHLQLMRSGFPIDWWTLAELFDIRPFGPKPKIPDPNDPSGETMVEAQTILERWIAQKEMEARFAAAAQGGQSGAGGGKGKGKGRPPTGGNPPAMEQKSDGRPIIRESKR